MQETPHSGPTRASAAAVPPLGLRCVGAMATRHSSSRLHSGHDQDGDVLKGCEPRRSHEPVFASRSSGVLANITDALRRRLAERVTIDAATGCWPCSGATNGVGYIQINVDGVRVLAHRLSYAIHVGPLDESLTIDHLCRNRRCVNPAHLEQVTAAENIRRTPVAHRSHCERGHPFDAANTRIEPKGGRSCRACARLRLVAYRARKKARGEV